MKTILYYQQRNGNSPFKNFFDLQPVKVKVKILREFQLISEYGMNMSTNIKYLKDGIFEIKIRINPFQVRVLFFHFENNQMIITNGFNKKTKKTPKSEIEKAIKYKKEFENMKRKGESNEY